MARSTRNKGVEPSHLLLLLSFLSVPLCQAIWPFSSDDRVQSSPPLRVPKALPRSQDSLPHFEVEGGSGKELAEQYAKQNGLIEAGNDCRQRAYAELQRSCREIMQVADVRHRLAIQFANCFAAESGKPTFPCPDRMSIKDCTAPMNDLAHSSYRSFFIHVDATCHHLQSEYFTQRTESIVNRLVSSSHRTAEQLSSVSDKSDAILERADKSLAAQRSLERKQESFQTLLETSMDDVMNTTGKIREGVSDVMTRQETVAKRQEEIAWEQAEKLGRLAAQTERVSDGVSRSLEGQGKLLEGQEEASRKLGELKEEQEKAFQMHTERLRDLSGIAEKHAKEVAEFQAGMEAAQARLASGSAMILEQQASFASKQADVFSSLDRMFSLYGTIVSESMALKSLLFYAAAVTIAYVLTATKRTHNARFWLCCGLTANFAVECVLVRYLSPAEQTATVTAGIQITRAAFALYALVVLGTTLLTYRDYAALSYSLLEAQSAKLADIEKRLSIPPDNQLSLIPNPELPRQTDDGQLSLVAANGRAPRQTEAVPSEVDGLDVIAYWAETRKWEEESNADPSSSDESYAPSAGLEGVGLRQREGYSLRERPRPAWSEGRDILEDETGDEFAFLVHMRSLYKSVGDLVCSCEASSTENGVSESYCDSHLDEELADEASSHGPVASPYTPVAAVVGVQRAIARPRRGRRRSTLY